MVFISQDDLPAHPMVFRRPTPAFKTCFPYFCILLNVFSPQGCIFAGQAPALRQPETVFHRPGVLRFARPAPSHLARRFFSMFHRYLNSSVRPNTPRKITWNTTVIMTPQMRKDRSVTSGMRIFCSS